MSKIEVGEYVRTDNGEIKLVTQELKDFIDEYESLTEKDFVEFLGRIKHSKQLIDLIENKDVLKVRSDKTILFLGIDECTSDIKYKELIESIKNGEYELLEILTHEQFEANCYKVGGEN